MKKVPLFLLLISLIMLFLFACSNEKKDSFSPYTEAEISAVYSAEGNVITNTAFRFYNSSENVIRVLPFVIYAPTEYSQAEVGARSVEIIEVKQNGVRMDYDLSEVLNGYSNATEKSVCAYLLKVPLSEELFPGESATVDISVVVTGYKAIKDSMCEVLLQRFYPVLLHCGEQGFSEFEESSVADSLFSEIADITLKLTVPGEFSVACGGECVKTEVSENQTEYTFSCRNFSEVAVYLAKGIEVFSLKNENAEISSFAFEQANMEEFTEKALDALMSFCEITGLNPFSSYCIVFSRELKNASYPGLEIISENEVVSGKEKEIVLERIALQWAKHVLRSNVEKYPWFSGAAGKFLTYRALARKENLSAVEKMKNADYARFCGFYGANANIYNCKEYCKELRAIAKNELSAVECGVALLIDNAASVIGKEATEEVVCKIFSEVAFKEITPEKLVSYLSVKFDKAEQLFYD